MCSSQIFVAYTQHTQEHISTYTITHVNVNIITNSFNFLPLALLSLVWLSGKNELTSEIESFWKQKGFQ